ncbi:MAG: 2-oxoacid:acceptor oxidoreductase subunit alpha [Methanolinea sp.]|nr:2-oxoacid:acceptor oxidoreductase subunit alpha [Methanolinea sp.]
MDEISVLIGGRAGDGINSAGLIVAHLFSQLGYQAYMYFDYPSLIKGGHNFTIIRASRQKVGAFRAKVDFLLALNQDCLDLHTARIDAKTVVICDSSRVRAEGICIPIPDILKEEHAPPVMGNSCIIGAFARAAGIGWEVVEKVLTQNIRKGLDQNKKVARRGFDMARGYVTVPVHDSPPLPLLSGNEAIGLGLLHGGLEAYIAYPMTPTSNLLHFLAEVGEGGDLLVFHPENEIAVILMALGMGYTGKKTAVGTSGGGFCLMTEGLSLSGMNEIPVVVVLGQRAGPSTGMPTYTAQSDLHFALHAGQGEFPRLVVAPGDAEQAFFWSSLSLQLAWKFQVPAIILCDKTLCEGYYSFSDPRETIPTIQPQPPGIPGTSYLRYKVTDDGVTPPLYPPTKETVIKVNGYTHDEAGITTEKAELAALMVEKRVRKGMALERELALLPTVSRYGDPGADSMIVCWGSVAGVCREVADSLGMGVVQPVVLAPFPKDGVKAVLGNPERVLVVEENACGQMEMLLACHGIRASGRVHKYDGRPFTVEELKERIAGVP